MELDLDLHACAWWCLSSSAALWQLVGCKFVVWQIRTEGWSDRTRLVVEVA